MSVKYPVQQAVPAKPTNHRVTRTGPSTVDVKDQLEQPDTEIGRSPAD
jgi:hypothetical protein